MPQRKSVRTKHPSTVGGASTPPREVRPVGRERMNLMVDRSVLARAAAVGATNMSEVVNMALQRMAEDDAIVAGLDAALGAIPDSPFADT